MSVPVMHIPSTGEIPLCVMPAKAGIHLLEIKMKYLQSLRDFGNDDLSNSVIPEKSLFSAQRKNVILSGIPFGFASEQKQMGFRINFLSPPAKRKFCGMTQSFSLR